MLARLADHIHLLQYAHILWGFAFFCGVGLWAYLPSRKRKMQHYATLILSDDTPAERGRHEQ